MSRHFHRAVGNWLKKVTGSHDLPKIAAYAVAGVVVSVGTAYVIMTFLEP